MVTFIRQRLTCYILVEDKSWLNDELCGVLSGLGRWTETRDWLPRSSAREKRAYALKGRLTISPGKHPRLRRAPGEERRPL